MNNTEQFDEWIRGEMDSLDDSPDNFRQADIWQKLQTELHPVSEKKSFFVTLKASHYRIAAAVALLFLIGGVWWKTESTPTQIAVNQKVDKPHNRPVLQQKQNLLAAKNDELKEKVTFKKHESRRKQSEEKPTEANSIQAPISATAESDNNVGKVPNLADVPELPKNIAEAPEIAEVVTVPTNPTNKSTAKTTPKPRFKIVHANELADYQKTELAEVREKEAKAKGFVVINWNANSTNQPTNSLLTYFKNKSSKAN